MIPIIGITAAYNEDEERLFLSRFYVDAVSAVGGLPLVIPPLHPDAADAVFDSIDGLLLSGGGDLDPFHFGEEPLPCTGQISPRRDVFELTLARTAVLRRLPVLGVCRGMQLLNVAAGGSIHQDLSQGATQPLKHDQDAPRWYPTHTVRIQPGSKLGVIFGRLEIRVNSFHHQSINRLAEGFKCTARSPDGVVEGIESGSLPFAVGVQCHPELMWEKDSIFRNIFAALVDSCSLKRSNSTT
ncbi:MAG: gamma-glutamyl-gamma-aminobutyrate hydrolase family protein [Bacillota bacterium]